MARLYSAKMKRFLRPTDFNRLRWLRIHSIAILFVFAACGDRVILLECPLGTMPQGSTCVPYEPPQDIYVPPLADGLGDFAVESETTVSSDATAEVGHLDTDAKPADVTVAEPAIGSPCVKAADCGEGGTCLNWPGGYCSRLDCTVATCPDGSHCVPVSGGNSACLRGCDQDTDCSNLPQQACKQASTAGGPTSVRVCYGLSEEAGPIGAHCQSPSDCEGPALCEALSPDGYCSLSDCESSGCPQGARCARLQGHYFCMRECASDGDCAGGDEGEQTCLSLKDPDKKPIDVCSPGGGDQVIGEACVSDIECTSAECLILGAGRCSQSKAPCDTELDCGGAEFCNAGPQNTVGYCSGNCSLNLPCPGAGFCALSNDLNTGICRAACPSGTDAGSCPVDDGFSCVYGVPLGAISGKFLCHIAQAGEVGSPCTNNEDCPAGSCSGGSENVCIQPCSADFECPFPGTCHKDADGSTMCRPTCLSASDCSGKAVCEPAMGGQANACIEL